MVFGMLHSSDGFDTRQRIHKVMKGQRTMSATNLPVIEFWFQYALIDHVRIEQALDRAWTAYVEGFRTSSAFMAASLLDKARTHDYIE